MKASDLFGYKTQFIRDHIIKSRVEKLLKKTKDVSPYRKSNEVNKRNRFWIKDKSSDFSCPLRSLKCCAKTSRGTPCKRNVVHGILFCFQHTRSLLNIRIDASGIITSGGRIHGLFACDSTKSPNAIVFKKGQEICPYFGEILNKNQIKQRYIDGITAPYGLQVSNDKYIDSACFQSIGAKANKAPTGVRNNAKFVTAYTKPYARVVAQNNIRNGKEIFVSYGQSYRFTNSGTKPNTKVKAKKQSCGCIRA